MTLKFNWWGVILKGDDSLNDLPLIWAMELFNLVLMLVMLVFKITSAVSWSYFSGC